MWLRAWQAIRNALSALKTNFNVCRDQFDQYVVEVRCTVIPGIKEAAWYRKPHKAFAFVEEFPDKAPRITAYLFTAYVLYRLGVFLLG